jgi:hypothetical protein
VKEWWCGYKEQKEWEAISESVTVNMQDSAEKRLQAIIICISIMHTL